MIQKDRRTDILKAAVELFARKGFRGTTTRDLATQADVNEAIIFRHFNTKEELYRAILEEKIKYPNKEAKVEELCQLVDTSGDEQFLSAIGRLILERHEDATFLRLLLFSALEGHELSDMFVDTVGRSRFQPLFGTALDTNGVLAMLALTAVLVRFAFLNHRYAEPGNRL